MRASQSSPRSTQSAPLSSRGTPQSTNGNSGGFIDDQVVMEEDSMLVIRCHSGRRLKVMWARPSTSGHAGGLFGAFRI